MIGAVEFWSGDDWQEFCIQILRLRFGADLHVVPDKDRGDLGIEAFARDGSAYQCYAAEEPLSTERLYEKQRDKMTTDIEKLCRNEAELLLLLGPIQIRMWGFLVPRFDSRRLIAHATAKASYIKQRGLACVHPDFFIQILTADDFPAERASISALGLVEVQISSKEFDVSQVDVWEQDRPSLVDTLTAKIAKIQTLNDSDQRRRLRQHLMKMYLQGENVLDQLRQSYPDMWAEVLREKQSRESHLEAEWMLSSDPANDLLLDTVNSYRDAVINRVPALRRHAESVAWATVADWLIRCPLDFR
jgi:hypothetical protein